MNDGIWVNSDLTVDQVNYVATIHFTGHFSYPLDRDVAGEYVAELMSAWCTAEYDAAVFAQLTQKLGMDEDQGTRLMAQFRKQRSKTTFKAGPMALEPGVSVSNNKPFMKCSVGTLVWQWNGADVRQHALHVLESISAADHDTTYRSFLVGMDIDPIRALAVVEDISNFRDAS